MLYVAQPLSQHLALRSDDATEVEGDLLEPDSPLLCAIDRLHKSPAVQEHTILGEGYYMLRAGDSDKVVPVASASRPDVQSEKRIHEKHGDLHQSDEGIREVICILRKHAVEK